MEILLLVAVAGLFYAITVRPQQRQQREHAQLVASLEVGDEIVTNAGLYGTITDLEDDIVHLEVDTDVVVRIARKAVVRLDQPLEADDGSAVLELDAGDEDDDEDDDGDRTSVDEEAPGSSGR